MSSKNELVNGERHNVVDRRLMSLSTEQGPRFGPAMKSQFSMIIIRLCPVQLGGNSTRRGVFKVKELIDISHKVMI